MAVGSVWQSQISCVKKSVRGCGTVKEGHKQSAKGVRAHLKKTRKRNRTDIEDRMHHTRTHTDTQIRKQATSAASDNNCCYSLLLHRFNLSSLLLLSALHACVRLYPRIKIFSFLFFLFVGRAVVAWIYNFNRKNSSSSQSELEQQINKEKNRNIVRSTCISSQSALADWEEITQSRHVRCLYTAHSP